MVLAAGSSLVGLVMGLRILCHDSDLRGQTTSVIFFLCGETAAGPHAQGGPGGWRGQGPRGRDLRPQEVSPGEGLETRGGVRSQLEEVGVACSSRAGGSRGGVAWDGGRGPGGTRMRFPGSRSPGRWLRPRPAAAHRLDRLHGEECVEKRRLLLLVLFFRVAGFTILYYRG